MSQSLQLGPSERSRYFVYWVPAQYIAAIREVLGLYGSAPGSLDAALLAALGFQK